MNKLCSCGLQQSHPIPHEHDQTEREKAIIAYYQPFATACDGINPDAVPKLLKALEAAVMALETLGDCVKKSSLVMSNDCEIGHDELIAGIKKVIALAEGGE